MHFLPFLEDKIGMIARMMAMVEALMMAMVEALMMATMAPAILMVLAMLMVDQLPQSGCLTHSDRVRDAFGQLISPKVGQNPLYKTARCFWRLVN